MPQSFSAQPTTISTLFSGSSVLQVPSYQRNYAWGTAEISRLLDNLIEGALTDEPPEYFLGSVLLLSDPSLPESANRFIIDGQQRLITLTILLCALRDRTPDTLAKLLSEKISLGASPASSVRIQIREVTAEFFLKNIQTNGATLDEVRPAEVSASTETLFNARHLICAIVDRLSNDERNALADFVLNNCILILIGSNQIDRAYSIFTVINDSGKDLTRLEILKAQFIGSLPDVRRGRVEDLWVGHERKLGPAFDELLTHLCTAKEQKRTSIIQNIRELESNATSTEEFLDSTLFPAANAFAEIIGAERQSPEREKFFGFWRPLNHENWIPPMLVWLQNTPQPGPMDQPFLTALDRLTMTLMLLGVGRDKRIARYRDVIRAITAGSVLDAGSPIHLTSLEQRQALANLSRKFYSRGQQICRLLMLRINEQILLQEGLPSLGVAFGPEIASIEHVLPKNPADSSQWRTWFPDNDVRDYCTDSLGNLVLISLADNHRIRNKDFASKKAIIFDGQSAQKFPVTAMLANYNEWRPGDILRRDEKLIATVAKMFDLNGPKGIETIGENRRKKLEPLLTA